MSSLILILVVILAAPALALRNPRRGGLITARPFNNPYAGAPGARDTSFG